MNNRLFSSEETTQYLQRIQLNYQEIEPLDQAEKLKKLHLSHVLNIPFDTTAVHLPSRWWVLHQNDKPVTLISRQDSSIQPESISVQADQAFNNIIKERRGGYCWSLNSCFARLLITLGYQVSQLPARVFSHRNQDPNVVGYSWAPLCHECLLVETQSGKFLCDVGFGGGSSAYPIPLQENLEIETLTLGEKFRIVQEKCLGLDDNSTHGEGYTVQRWCGQWWSPCYHFYLSPIVFEDVKMFNWFSATHPESFFQSRLIVTILRSDGSRRSLTCSSEKNGTQGEIKLATRKHVNAEETDVSLVNPTYSDLHKALRQEFQWGPT